MWTWEQSRGAVDLIARFGRPNLRLLLSGSVATVGVALLRLAMPWPLRGVVEIVFPSAGKGAATLVEHLPSSGEPVLWLALLYLLLAAGVGACEMGQRVWMKQFAAQTVRDMRAAAVRAAVGPRGQRQQVADLIVRVVGDAARINAGLAGILVHVSQNGLLFLLVCGTMLVISPKLGLVFLLAGVIVLVIGFLTAAPVADTAAKNRRREADYAEAIAAGLSQGDPHGGLDAINAASTRKDVRTTKLITRSTLLTHVVLAAAVGLALWSAVGDVAAGRLDPGEVFLFIAYTLTVHRRMVQVGRQAARAGKVVACADRIGSLLGTGEAAAPVPPRRLTVALRLVQAGVGERRTQLKPLDLDIRAGSRVAVVGRVGAGKTSLLELLAGIVSPRSGALFWDDDELTHSPDVLAASASYLPESPVFGPQRLWQVLGLSGPDADLSAHQALLDDLGVWRFVSRARRGLQARVSSTRTSRGEARALQLARLLITSSASVWLLDDPAGKMAGKAARRCMARILEQGGERTLVVAMGRAVEIDRFDRVLMLRRGKVTFDDSPSRFKARKTVAAVGT